MDDKYFDYWIRLEDQVSSEIGCDIQINTNSSLADNFVEDCDSKGFDSAVYDMKWLLIYHWEYIDKSIRRLLEDYPEIEIV